MTHAENNDFTRIASRKGTSQAHALLTLTGNFSVRKIHGTAVIEEKKYDQSKKKTGGKKNVTKTARSHSSVPHICGVSTAARREGTSVNCYRVSYIREVSLNRKFMKYI